MIALLVVLLVASACSQDSEAAELVESAPVATIAPAAEPTVASTPEPVPAEPRFALTGEIGLEVAELNDMMTFVEEATGREFLRPPMIVAQNEADYEAGLLPTDDELADVRLAMESDMRMMQAMGLTDLGAAQATDAWLALMTSTDGVLGRYDIEADTIYVPVADEVDDGFRSTVVHELVHALDGQHVDLGAFEQQLDDAADADDFDTAFALLSIVEGRAQAVQSRWDHANAVVPDAELPAGIEHVPPAAVLATVLPYQLGAQYVEANGGPAQTWDLYENPPLTSEAILTGALDGEVLDVPIPVADGAIINETPFGAVDLLIMLIGRSLEPSPAAVPVAMAADGWAGGHLVVWGDEAESCIRLHVAAASETDLFEMQRVLSAWVDEEVDARAIVVENDLVEVTGCAPYLP